MARFDRELKTIVGLEDPEDVYKYFEVESIIVSAYLSAEASKARKESRWGRFHTRMDYPERDDQNWKKHVILQKNDTGEYAVDITYQDVERMG